MAMNYPYPTAPTSQGAYTTGIRSALKQKGISDEQITYDPNKGVMVGGTPFIRPEKNYGGSTFTSPQNFQSAWENYSKALTQPMAGTTAGFTQTGTPTTTGTTQAGTATTGAIPLNEQINKIIQGLQNYGQNQPAFDPYSSAAHQAAQAQTQRQTQQGIRSAQEAFGSAGFGRSTALGERAQRIGQEGTEYLMTQVLPQIQAQEQARRQQEYQNTLSALQPLLGQQSREDQLALQQAQLTGNIPISPESQGIIDQLIGLKQQAETAGVGGATAETMGQFRSQGDVLRNQLANMGIDVSGLGAETSAADVRIPRGVQTQAARQFEQGVQERQQEFSYKQARDKIADEQYKQKFDEDVRRFGMEFAADEAVKNRQLSQADARIALEQAQETRLGQGAAGGGTTPAPKNVSTSQFNDIYSTLLPRHGVANYDDEGKVSYTPSQNEDIQARTVLDILNYNLSDDDTLKLLNKFGITEERARQLLGG